MSGGPMGHYPYPLDKAGKPVDTPEWRNPDDIKKTASAVDTQLIKATRNFDSQGMEAVEAALKMGGDVNARDKHGFSCLHLAIKNKNSSLAFKFLELDQIDINAKTNRGFTPLMTAAWKGDTGVATQLIAKGADLFSVDSGGRNAWGVAHDWHKDEMLELFKRHGLVYKEGDKLAFPPHPKWRDENVMADAGKK